MAHLRDINWKRKYSPPDGDLLHLFYVPLLRCAVSYDRTIGFYSAQTLAAASAGVEALIANGGKMRLIVGCTLDENEIEAIRKGEKLKDTVEAKLLASPFEPGNSYDQDALELLAWMVAKGHLEIKAAVTCHPHSPKPLAGGIIFHEKAGMIRDAAGDRLVFNGSLNETLAGWQSQNWDTFHVFCSWKDDVGHLEDDESTFARLWADEEPTALVLSISDAVKQRLLDFLPQITPCPAASPLTSRKRMRPPKTGRLNRLIRRVRRIRRIVLRKPGASSGRPQPWRPGANGWGGPPQRWSRGPIRSMLSGACMSTGRRASSLPMKWAWVKPFRRDCLCARPGWSAEPNAF